MKLCCSFTLECAHSVEQPVGVPTLHGHSYVVTVCIESDPRGPRPLPMLQGYADLVKAELDHRNLNDVLDVPATMEAIAWKVRDLWTGPELVAVRVARPTMGASAEWEA